MARRGNSYRRRRREDRGFLFKLLSMLVICVCVVAALTMFFRVKTVEINGAKRYTAEEIQAAAEIEDGDNLFLFNKHTMAAKITEALPYIENLRINRKLPDTLIIDVRECEYPLVVVQDGFAWFFSPSGRIVEQAAESKAEGCPQVTGCELLAPAVGTKVAIATEYATQQTSLLALTAALEEAGMMKNLDGIRLEDPNYLRMDYADRFTVKLLYGADYAYKLRALSMFLADEKIQDNMTGTFDMTRDDRNYFQQNVR